MQRVVFKARIELEERQSRRIDTMECCLLSFQFRCIANPEPFQMLQPARSLLLLIHSKLLQRLQIHALQRPLIRSRQHNLGHLLVIIARPVLKRLLPAAHTQTPLAAALEPNIAQIVSLRSAVVQELLCNDAGDAVVAKVRLGRFAVAGAREACQRLCGVEREGLLEY